MANFVVSYDLNGPTPSHKQMDDHLGRVGARRIRILETVWWVDYRGTAEQLLNHLKTILRSEDRLLVCNCTSLAWENLLVTDQTLTTAWHNAG